MIAYGAVCTWWDDKSKVSTNDGTPTGLPCCPHCGGVLYEADTDEWWRNVRAFDTKAAGSPFDRIADYPAFVEWTRDRCRPLMAGAGFAAMVDEWLDEERA